MKIKPKDYTVTILIDSKDGYKIEDTIEVSGLGSGWVIARPALIKFIEKHRKKLPSHINPSMIWKNKGSVKIRVDKSQDARLESRLV